QPLHGLLVSERRQHAVPVPDTLVVVGLDALAHRADDLPERLPERDEPRDALLRDRPRAAEQRREHPYRRGLARRDELPDDDDVVLRSDAVVEPPLERGDGGDAGDGGDTAVAV